ncbi:unnamed protein product [Cylicocyclus nassatus]|uniref:Uncharacterized protein n=1 Tax=Cylicocyclus nassatus TaxID=53992 RepID=A0AA36H708_CYLNA|nr:unnamed protein product [Cylicocyclus nassatus]
MKSMRQKIPEIGTSAFKKTAATTVKWSKKTAAKSVRRGKGVVDDLQNRLGRKRFFMILGAIGIVILLVIIIIIIVAATKKRGSEPTDPPEEFNSTSSTMITTRVQSTTSFIHPSVSTSSQTKFFINTTTTTLHTTTTSKSTRKPTAPIHCMFVGDVFNLGNDTTTSPFNYEDERAMLDQAGEMLLEKRGNNAGIWAYGHVTHTEHFQKMFNKSATEWLEFSGTLREMMTYKSDRLFPHAGPEANYNVGIFKAINTTGDLNEKANCLVFLSAMSNTVGFKVAPEYNYKRIVVVNLAEGDFGSIVDEHRGEVVKVTQPYDDKANAVKIHEAILRGFY